MRIIAGTARGRTLSCPRGRRTRPTPDRIREAVFSVLGPEVRGETVVDLFAGTGALGLEALSRGARSAVFVEKDPGTVRCLRRNIAACGFEEVSTVVAAPVLSFIGSGSFPARVGIVFMDPPYRSDLGTKALLALAKNANSFSIGLIVFECASTGEPPELPPGFSLTDRRVYGDTAVLFMEVESDAG